MSEARKLIRECRKTLAEIRSLVGVLESMPQSEVLKRVRALPLKEKAVLVDMMRRGGISQRVESVRRKNPSYIL